jgi:S-adenosylmethionine:tRNA ribosyltransferase-isomerase
MEITRFDFDLPPELIAQNPVDVRDQSRLLVINRKTRSVSHHIFSELPGLLPRGAVLFRNNASVLPARLRGRRPSGGEVECLLLTPTEHPAEWWCLVRPGRKLPVRSRFSHPGNWSAEVVQVAEDGRRLVRFETVNDDNFLTVVNAVGEMPLPPYIRRDKADRRTATDKERYQTVYARADKQVAAAAPTAGLHFTPSLETELQQNGFSFTDLTLHIGLGTFQPIKTEQVEEHQIHHEIYEMPPAAQQILRHSNPPPRVAIGTTATRAMEDYLRKTSADIDTSRSFVGEADIYLYPPAQFGGVDALITNLHLPRSSLLCLVSAFLTPGATDGVSWLQELYAEAIRERYRFFSYGDAMLIV